MDERYTIDTPENIEFAYDVAGIGSRFLAAIFDTLLIVLLQLGLGLALLLVGSQIDATEDSVLTSLLFALWAILSFVLFWGYYLLFEIVWNGQSPGKRLIGLQVVREGGRPITFLAAAIRNLIRIVDFLPGFYGLGVLVMFVDRHARRLGDLAAGTLVVKDRRAVTLEHLTAAAAAPAPVLPGAQPAAPATLALPNLHLLTDNDYDLVQEFLRRRASLGAASRRHLGTLLADQLRQRLGLTLGGNPEIFLENVAREYRLFKQGDRVTG